ncbi:MAG: HAMP domain-containing histidine kinase, partial [Ignavibacteriaceae bacterium]|nr:HAMP domain-containing histidine kinase [Ignavibacteriaceae bacterium]
MLNLVPSWARHYEEFWMTIRRRNIWFIKLRYAAVVMLVFLLFGAEYILKIELSGTQLTLIIVITSSILVYNGIFHFIRKYLKSDPAKFNPLHLSFFQIIFDLSALMLLVYYTGGIESPLYMLAVFHMIIGSLILPGFIIYTIAAAVVFCFAFISFGQHLGAIPHHELAGLLNVNLTGDLNYIIAFNIVFTFVIFTSVLLANKIAKQLYKQEQDLVESLYKINAAEAEKQKYIMGIVHEIKTPLAAVQAYLDLILQKFLGPLDEVVEEKLKRAKRRSDEAIELINSILKISKMKLLDSIAYESMMIDVVIQTTVDHQMVNAKAKNVSIMFRDERKEKIPIYGDSFLMQIAISNLINNAIKYVDFEGIIEVTLANKDDDLIINVC